MKSLNHDVLVVETENVTASSTAFVELKQKMKYYGAAARGCDNRPPASTGLFRVSLGISAADFAQE